MKTHIILTAVSISLALTAGGCGAGEKEKISVNPEISVQGETESEGSSTARIEIGEVSDSGSGTQADTHMETAPNETEAKTESQTGNFRKEELVSELKQLEKQAAELETRFSSARSQIDMTRASQDLYELWDGALNQFWGRLKEIMNEEDFSDLTKEERQWITKKDAEVSSASEFCEGGTMYPMVVAGKAAELTRKRVYELAEILSAENGQACMDNFSGSYISPASEETDRLPCNLYLHHLGVGTYDTELGLGPGASWKLNGIARADGDTLLFEDLTLGVKGTITHKNSGLVFIVTESELEEAAAGTRFDFPEKYEYPAQFSFADLSGLEFWFGSGAGAWRTVLYVKEDGSFDGEYLDTDMGSRESYLCDFKGKFTVPEQINEYTWSVKIESLELANEPGTSEIKDDSVWHYSDPYGLTDADEILFYLPNAPIAELPEDFKSWAAAYSGNISIQALLPFYGLYNLNGRQGFSSHPTAG